MTDSARHMACLSAILIPFGPLTPSRAPVSWRRECALHVTQPCRIEIVRDCQCVAAAAKIVSYPAEAIGGPWRSMTADELCFSEQQH